MFCTHPLLHPAEVFRQNFWMRLFGGPSAKRTRMWSNSKQVCLFQNGRLRAKHRGREQLARKTRSSTGKVGYTGSKKALKTSQILVWLWHLFPVLFSLLLNFFSRICKKKIRRLYVPMILLFGTSPPPFWGCIRLDLESRWPRQYLSWWRAESLRLWRPEYIIKSGISIWS